MIEPARDSHVYEIVQRLREHDRAAFASVDDPARVLIDELRQSTRAYVYLLDGEVLCLWAMRARTLLLDAVYLWMIASPLIDRHPVVFVRRSKTLLRELLEEYGAIEGHVWCANDLSIRWLKWLGARFEPSPLDGVLAVRLGRT
jgi:hypothetical protein